MNCLETVNPHVCARHARSSCFTRFSVLLYRQILSKNWGLSPIVGRYQDYAAGSDVSDCFGRHIHNNSAINTALNIGKPDRLSATVPLMV